MHLIPESAAKRQGSILLGCMFLTLITAGALTCYLGLVMNQNQLTYRSQTWHCSLVLAESGIEEGLQHCSANSSSLAGQGWGLSSGRYAKTSWVGSGYFTASISSTAPYDVISTGYFPAPSGAAYVSRTVKVTTAPSPSFTGAMASKGTIDLNGNKTEVNSYDSRSSATSTSGKYDPAKKSDKADIILASGGTLFDLGNGDIWGHAYTGPTVTLTTGPNGGVGSAAYMQAGTHGVQAGWWINNANVSIPDVSAPFTAATPPAPGVVGGVAYDYVLAGGDYMMATLDKTCVVTGDAVLYVTGNISSSMLTIQSNASVRIYCAGASASFNTVNNYNTAVSLLYFGLPTNTSVDFGGSWVGGMYAPEADFNITGNNEISGALVAKTIRMRGNSQFHYDQALSFIGSSGAVVVTSWNEL